jgi:hypothetical protein
MKRSRANASERRGKTIRARKYVGIHPHFFEQVKNRRLYRSLRNARNDIIKAVKKVGVLVPQPEEGKFLCVFKNGEDGRCCTASVLETERAFMVITVWESSEWEKKKYKFEKKQLTN